MVSLGWAKDLLQKETLTEPDLARLREQLGSVQKPAATLAA